MTSSTQTYDASKSYTSTDTAINKRHRVSIADWATSSQCYSVAGSTSTAAVRTHSSSLRAVCLDNSPSARANNRQTLVTDFLTKKSMTDLQGMHWQRFTHYLQQNHRFTQNKPPRLRVYRRKYTQSLSNESGSEHFASFTCFSIIVGWLTDFLDVSLEVLARLPKTWLTTFWHEILYFQTKSGNSLD